MKLKPKEIRFCEEYPVDLNGTQAAIRAGYSANSARTIASNLLAKEYIQNRIQETMNKRSERTGVTADKVIRELARIAFVDPNDLFDQSENGVIKLKKLSEISEDDAAVIQGFKYNDKGYLEAKIYDKLSALDKLGKHLKLFTDVNENHNSHSFTQMGRIKAEKITDKTTQPTKVTLSFDVGSPIENDD